MVKPMTSQELSRNATDQQDMPIEWASFVHNIVTQLTSENVALTYDLNNVRIAVPGSSSNGAEKAQWVIDGSITVRGTKGTQ